MSKINLPAFTAEASLYKTSERYNMVMLSDGLKQEIIPQQIITQYGQCMCSPDMCCCCDKKGCTCGDR